MRISKVIIILLLILIINSCSGYSTYYIIDKSPVILCNMENMKLIGDYEMCKIKDCKEQKIYAKGYCHYHYLKQWKKQLSPEKRQKLREQSLKYHHIHKHEVKYRARIKKYYLSCHGKIVRSKVARNFRQRLKLEVLKHYSVDSVNCPRCVNCGFEDMRALCLDHIDNNGATHRKELFGDNRKGSSIGMYSWLKNNNYPDGFQVLCANCNLIKEFERRRPKYEA